MRCSQWSPKYLPKEGVYHCAKVMGTYVMQVVSNHNSITDVIWMDHKEEDD